MDRHPQQIKRTRQDKTRRARNITRMSELKTAVKNVLAATEKAEAEKLYASAVSTIDKMASKNMIHKNTAARRKAQITRHLNSLS
ncbi:MAG: 30S ribosomal protein S20 [Candidatus Marinimicrobia bacterium]|jgi:small subunit ribosomal protein S20|nr:30S ribosomal protein S20 [Candidatus Neomarinimicrobiota bacterium]MDP6790259.1 30S ribosomal protein S20 [Candidatus Neomarinimicrobiota bacterium]MDP7072216.1 30S ribosomal protein S20 [Candidatus Neomarinimicrobiota bacterium]|tara:strand:+ start:197 stop:451 length:255 start_codon:yes stop_codon:yes gene_type:complete